MDPQGRTRRTRRFWRVGKLAALTAFAVAVIPGVAAASITEVREGNDITTVGATNGDAELFDTLQKDHLAGPCLQAAWTGEVVHVRDFSSESRWPALGAEVVARTAIRSSVSYRLFTSEHGMGALNVYSDRPHVFDAAGDDLAHSLAAQAALVVDAARRHDHLRSALATRDILSQAKGVIMERFMVDAGKALELLATVSENTGVPMPEVARRLVVDHPRRARGDAVWGGGYVDRNVATADLESIHPFIWLAIVAFLGGVCLIAMWSAATIVYLML